jgi:hypothetical protein
MLFYPTFNTTSVISWLTVLLVEETGVPGVHLSQVTDKLYCMLLHPIHLAVNSISIVLYMCMLYGYCRNIYQYWNIRAKQKCGAIVRN